MPRDTAAEAACATDPCVEQARELYGDEVAAEVARGLALATEISPAERRAQQRGELANRVVQASRDATERDPSRAVDPGRLSGEGDAERMEARGLSAGCLLPKPPPDRDVIARLRADTRRYRRVREHDGRMREIGNQLVSAERRELDRRRAQRIVRGGGGRRRPRTARAVRRVRRAGASSRSSSDPPGDPDPPGVADPRRATLRRYLAERRDPWGVTELPWGLWRLAAARGERQARREGLA